MVRELQDEALQVLAGGGKGGAKREGWSGGIATSKGSSWESDKGEGEGREKCEGGCTEQPHTR